MKLDTNSELIYQMFALIISIIVVHAVYVTIIRPRAEVLLEAQAARFAAGELVDVERSIYIIVHDPEQEVCTILALWCLAIIGRKYKNSWNERKLIRPELLEVTAGTSILPEDSRKYARALQALPEQDRELLLPRVLLTALQRFGTTRNIQDVSTAIQEVCDSEWNRLDSDLSLIRFSTWVIPAIGFIGTVRGIGNALIQAQRAVMGDIVGVTVSLGVAFNATLVALILAIIINFLLHQLQQSQERLVLDARRFCDANLIPHLQMR